MLPFGRTGGLIGALVPRPASVRAKTDVEAEKEPPREAKKSQFHSTPNEAKRQAVVIPGRVILNVLAACLTCDIAFCVHAYFTASFCSEVGMC